MSIEALVAHLVRPVASATEEDAALVRAELVRLPLPVLQTLADRSVGVRVCREAVTDYRADLRGEAPRGWPPGVDWTVVPGCYLPDERAVAIATVDRGGRRRIPAKGDRHGSWNLVIHETMHADDYAAPRRRSRNRDFVHAREADVAALDVYQRQTGAAGLEESYAESAARHFGSDPSFVGACPKLHGFWCECRLPVEPGPAQRGRHDGGAYIGTARFVDGGVLELDLSADEPVAVGAHALVRIAPDAEPYEPIRRSLDGRRRRSAADGDVYLLSPFPG